MSLAGQRKAFLVFIAVLVALGFWVRHDPGDPVTHSFTLRATLEVEGQPEPIEINETIECFEHKRQQGIGGRTLVYSFKKPRGVGVRFEDGSGVAMVVPSLCGAFNRRPNQNPLDPGHLPLIGLIDNVDEPNVVDVIIDAQTLKQKEAGVRLLSIAAELDDVVQTSSADYTFDWFGLRRELDDQTFRMVGYITYRASAELWRENSELNMELPPAAEVSLLKEELLRETGRVFGSIETQLPPPSHTFVETSKLFGSFRTAYIRSIMLGGSLDSLSASSPPTAADGDRWQAYSVASAEGRGRAIDLRSQTTPGMIRLLRINPDLVDGSSDIRIQHTDEVLVSNRPAAVLFDPFSDDLIIVTTAFWFFAPRD